MSMVDAAGDKTRFSVLDGMRGLAALCVMLDHFMSEKIHIFGHTLYPFAQSAVAVDLFFMLSGFVLAHSYGDRLRAGMPVTALLARRVVRLYPLYVLGTLMGLGALLSLVGAGATSFSLAQSFESAVANLLFLPFFSQCSLQDMKIHSMAVGPLFPSDTPTWTLFFEMVGTFLFAGLIRLKPARLAIFTALSFVLFVGYGLHTGITSTREAFNPSVGWSETNFVGGFLRVAFGLSAGMLLCALHQRAPESLRAVLPRALRRPWVIYAIMLCVLANPIGLAGVITALSLISIVPLLIAAGANPIAVDPRLARLSKLAGALSYPVFCLHYPIGRLVLIATAGHDLSNPAFTLIASGLSILASFAALRWIEPPCRAWLGARFLKATTRPVQAN